MTEDELEDYKEVFMLFDKDQDGVLSFQELGGAMRTLGQRLSGKCQWMKPNLFQIFYLERELLSMVRSVSEDQKNDTIEFNEFLRMMSKQNDLNMDKLVEAFK